MKFSIASTLLLLASAVSAAPGKTTTKKPTPPKTTTTTTPVPPSPTPDPAPPQWTPNLPWHKSAACPDIGQVTCQIAQADPSDIHAEPAALMSVFYAKGEINQWWGAEGKWWGCSNKQANTWEIQYCRMGPKGIGGVKVSTFISDMAAPISCYDVQQSLECISPQYVGCRVDGPADNWILGAWDYSSGNVKRMIKVEKPTEEDRPFCQPCAPWGDSQCA